MTREEKQGVVSRFFEASARYSCMIVVRQVGMNSALVHQLRKEAKNCNSVFKVFKNRLVKKALSEKNELNFAQFGDFFSGPTGVFFADDPVNLAKLIFNFSKKREALFSPIGGILAGKILKLDEIKKIAALSSLPQIRAQLLSLIQEPARRTMVVMQEPGCMMVRALMAYSIKLNEK